MLKCISDLNRKSGKLRFFVLPVFLLLLGIWTTAAQNENQTVSVRRINVLIDGQPGEAEMYDLITLKPGDKFSSNKINNSIKQIYKTGLFSFVEVQQEGELQTDLTFILTSRLFVRNINVSGDLDISQRRIKKQLFVLREESPYSTEKLNRAKAELTAVLFSEGHFDAQIKTYSERVPDSRLIDVFFQVQSTKKYTVEKIDFAGDVILSEQRLRKKMKTAVDKPFKPLRLEEDIEKLKELYAAEDYRRIEIRIKDQIFDQQHSSVSLALEVLPNEKIEIEISGADFPLSLVKPIWEARIFEEWGLDEGEAKIIQYLREKGYLFVSVNSSITREGSRIRIRHEIAPGERYKIEGISFQGMLYFSEDQLREELALNKGIPFFGGIEGDRLFELPFAIEFFYKTHGFPETKVDLNLERRDRKVRPILYIEEGRQQVIKRLSFQGLGLFSQEQILSEISSRQGGPFYQPTVQKDIEKLINFYLNEGVRGTDIRALVEDLGENDFAVTLQIGEGKKVVIDNVVITGNEVTKKSTILRELRIKSGDFARYGAIRETKQRLERLGVFTEVKIEELLLSPERENLLISLREGYRNYASMGLGLETKEEPRSFQVWNSVVRPRGTAEFIRSNIFGTAAQISLVGQISLKERRAVFSWEQPYFFGIPMQTFLNAWLEREARTSYTYDRQGVSLSGVKSLSESENMVIVTTLRYARTKLITLDIEQNALDRQFFPYSTTSVSASFLWDKRSDPFNPEKGYFLSSSIEWAYPLFNTESNFQKIFSKFQQYLPIWRSLMFSWTARLGLARGRIPIHERFFAGGSSSFRGAAFDELGPRDPISYMPVGGKALVLLNFEATFPILPQLKYLYGTLFFDTGNVFAKRSQVSLGGLQDAVGIGLRYKTPLGPVRLELGFNLDAPKGVKKTQIIITIGNIF